jgi:hypothetical protein
MRPVQIIVLSSIIAAVASLAGCMTISDPASSTADSNYNPSDPAYAEIADNPASSLYYTEPTISYGYPGDGVSDNWDTSSTYLASYSYSPASAGKGDAVTLALKSATETLMAKPGIV